jgi:hypothetical protein
MKVMISGEGSTELGEWAKEAPFRNTKNPEIGVIEAFMRRISTTPFAISSARFWKKVTKYRSGDHLQPETRTVLGLALDADEAGCNVVVFVRDRDGDRDRQADIAAGIKNALKQFSIPIVGGVAVEEVEAWILALKGNRRSEYHSDAKSILHQKHGIRGRAAMVAVIEDANLDTIADDAASLKQWTRSVSTTFLPKS